MPLMTKIIKPMKIKKPKDKKVILAGGCFDIIHEGHIQFLKRAKALGDILIILLESDSNIKKIKGVNRPLNNQNVRAQNLSKLDIIDYIIILDTPKTSNYYYNLVKLISPDIIAVTTGDPFLEDKKRQAQLVGGKVVEVMERDKKYSTTKIIIEGGE